MWRQLWARTGPTDFGQKINHMNLQAAGGRLE